MARVFVCGEALIDFVPGETAAGERAFRPLPGGSPFNVAKAAAKAGAQSEFVGAIGSDFLGDMLLDDLTASGASHAYGQRPDAPAPLAFVAYENGQPRYAFHFAGTADEALRPSLDDVPPEAGDIVHVGSISLAGASASPVTEFAMRESEGRMLSLDPNVRASMIPNRTKWHGRMDRLIGASTILKLSDEDLAYLAPGTAPEEFARNAIERGQSGDGPALVVVSGGETGAMAYAGKRSVNVRAPRVEVADTVGAGDTLMGSMLAWLQSAGKHDRAAIAAMGDEDLHAMLTFAATAAAINCTRHGCVPPSRNEIETFVREKA